MTAPSRRDFIKGVGGLAVAISLPNAWSPCGVAAAGDPFGPTDVAPADVDSWLTVGRDGMVTIYTGKVELGTGTLTATRQVVAEELDVAFGRTRIVQAITGRTVDQSYTAGSQTMRTQWASGLRIAAASARRALLGSAATRLGTAPEKLTVEDGVVRVANDPGRSVTYAQLAGGTRIGGALDRRVATKSPSAYRIVGQSIPREDIPAKVFGTFTYIQDVTRPGMLHGRVVRPLRPAPLAAAPTALAEVAKGTLTNARLVSVDESSVAHLPGNVRVVRVHDFVGVVADREEHAIAAAQALRVSWHDPADLPDQATLQATLLSTPPDTTRTLALTGDVEGAIAGAARKLQATYFSPYQLHGSIGPSCAVADVRGGKAEIWSGTQGVYQLRTGIAGLLGLPEQDVRITYVEGSGCYGINGADDVSMSAALLSRAAGRPVRVQHMRADEMAWENFGNAMVMSVAAGLDASGHVVGWDYRSWTANRGGRLPPAGNQPAGVLAGQPERPAPPSPPPGSPPSGDDGSNAYPWYDFGSQRVTSYGIYKKWLFTGPLRSPSRFQNTFAQESFMDELAAAAGADPVAFRLAHASDQRLAAVIRKAASSAGWQARPSPDPSQRGTRRSGRGIAAVRYEGGNSWVAAVIAVEVDTTTGRVTPTRIVVANDCGVVINPDGLINQIQGNIVQGISRSLLEEVAFDRSGVLSVDWTSYPIATFADLPDDVRIELVDRPDQPALGAGEPSISVIPGAFANAIFDATGARLRQLPFTPTRVRAALTG